MFDADSIIRAGYASLTAAVWMLFGGATVWLGACELTEPDPLPPRGDEAVIEKARTRLKKQKKESRATNCETKQVSYRDQDGDGYGDPKVSKKGCGIEPGYVNNNDDCYDKNDKVHPRQKSYFHVHRGDGRFDYDCDGKEKRRIRDRAFCRLKPDERGCAYASGWIEKKIPSCGQAGAWKWYECHEIHVPLTPEKPRQPPSTAGDPSTTEGAQAQTPRPRPAPRPNDSQKRGEKKETGPKVLPTKVFYRCRGKQLPWKKMQLCR
jgi:hypothetical protein